MLNLLREIKWPLAFGVLRCSSACIEIPATPPDATEDAGPVADASAPDASWVVGCPIVVDVNGADYEICKGEATTCLSQVVVSSSLCPSSLYCRDSKQCLAEQDAAGPPVDPPQQTPGCAVLGGAIQSTATVSYAYMASGGLYTCQWFQRSSAGDVCIYQTSQYQSSAINLCLGIVSANSCRFTVNTYDQKGNLVSTFTETEYFNLALWDAADISTQKTSCAAKGGTWQ